MRPFFPFQMNRLHKQNIKIEIKLLLLFHSSSIIQIWTAHIKAHQHTMTNMQNAPFLITINIDKSNQTFTPPYTQSWYGWHPSSHMTHIHTHTHNTCVWKNTHDAPSVSFGALIWTFRKCTGRMSVAMASMLKSWNATGEPSLLPSPHDQSCSNCSPHSS